MRTVSVVVPAYQEARRLPGLLTALRTHARDDLKAAGLTLHEMIVVDDGSSDGTGAVLAEAAQREPLLKGLTAPSGRRGKGHAVAHGIRHATGDLVLLVDVDLSAPLSETHKLTAVLDRGADIAIGSRAVEGARDEETPLYRALMGGVFNTLVRSATALEFRDTQCPIKLLDNGLAKRLVAEQIAPGFAFDVELLLRARREGARVVEVPIEFRHDPDSRVRPIFSAAAMTRDVLRVAIRLHGPARQRQRHPQRQAQTTSDEPSLDAQR